MSQTITCNQCGTDDCEHLTADSPPLDEVIQRPERLPAVPVTPTGTVEVDQMPRRLGTADNRLLAIGGGPVQIVGYDPRRQRITLGVAMFGTADGILIAGSEAELRHFRGLFQSGGTPQVRYDFDVCDELWVRPVDISATGVISASTGQVLVSWLTEMWSR